MLTLMLNLMLMLMLLNDNIPLRCVTMYKINSVWTDVLNTRAMKIYEVYNTDENIGPAPAGVC